MAASELLRSAWNEAEAAGLSAPEQLRYRSNLLGADRRITNFGGGNTSAKLTAKDPLSGEPVRVLWVKGSGGDLGSMALTGFATLYLVKLEALKSLYRGVEHEDEMVGYLPHCTFDLNPRAASIDTPLHAYLPYDHVDHMHPDAIIALAAAADGEALTRQIYGDRIGWLPWRRPGFELGLELERFARANPQAEGVVLGSHGLFTWADDGRRCYEITLAVINQAIGWLAEQTRGRAVFGGPVRAPLPAAERRRVAARLLPEIRGRIGQQEKKIGHFVDEPAVLEFTGSAELEPLAALGTSCPDHFLRTKVRPLVLAHDVDGAGLDQALADFRADYAGYYERNRRADSPAMRDPNAVVYLVPGVGMLTFARDKPTARIAGEYYVNAINVMRGAATVSRYQGLPESEAFAIEYWQLEEAKLQRMPKPKSLAGRVALVTGGAGGIGRAISQRLLAEGACVVLADLDREGLARTEAELQAAHGADQVRSVALDVTDEAAVAAGFEAALVDYGGLDILVSNAGISSAASVEDTTLEIWRRNLEILGTGYFLVAREAYRVMLRQGLGGAIVFIASKNGLAASPGASAYCTAKAAEIHLARCLALEGAPHGIRVNVVNPDAVLQGSKIWSSEWRQQRAAAYRIEESELEEHYRQRSLLKRNVLPEDVAAATCFLVSDEAAKSTGNILNVDAGNAQSFTR